MLGVLVIAGPTATGKTELAIELGDRIPIEIVNADALQVYRQLEIGTAKPSPSQRERVPHHLIDIRDADEPFSAGEFARLARTAIAEIQARGATPVIVGGSGFYLKALFDGLAQIPTTPAPVRAEVAAEIEERGVDAMWQRLHEIDRQFADSISPQDRQRVARGLEVHRATGRTISEWHSQEGEFPRLHACRVALTLPRPLLYDRIEARTSRMLNAGWLQEVRDLRERYAADAPAFQAIGYRTLVSVLEGRLSSELAFEEITRDTRRYAKRQLTWFRGDSRFTRVVPGDIEGLLRVWREGE